MEDFQAIIDLVMGYVVEYGMMLIGAAIALLIGLWIIKNDGQCGRQCHDQTQH